MKIADSLYISKIRYGVQLYGNVRLTANDSEQKQIGAIQVAQNKLARFLNGTNLTDKIKNEEIYKKLKIPTVNQINAQIKLLEVWKSLHSETYPTKWATRNDLTTERRTRAADQNQLHVEIGGSILNSTFKTDAAHVWNQAPECIKNCTTLYTVKKCIKKFIMTLPI